jgi:hypothetical protein
MGRLGLAFKCFFRVLGNKPLPEEALEIGKEDLPALPAPDHLEAEQRTRALQLLGMMQREGRLLDFLQEEIEAYDDAQIGAAVRNIHRDCRRVLQEHITVEPVVEGQEDSPYQVEVGFDPSQIRLIGNVTGDPPFSGVLRHHGWRARALDLPRPTGDGDSSVIAPAEVELP